MFTIRNLLTIRNFSLRNLSPAPSPVVSESGASTSSQTNWELRASRRSPRPIRTEGYHQPITRAASDIQEIQQQSSSISDRPIIDAAPRPKRPAGYIRVRHRMIVDELARARLHESTSADNTDIPEGQQIPADTPEIAAEYFRGFKTPGGLTDREIEARKRTIVILPTTFKGSDDEICNCCLNVLARSHVPTSKDPKIVRILACSQIENMRNYFVIERIEPFASQSRNTRGEIAHIRFNNLADHPRPDLALTTLIEQLLDRVLTGRPAPLRVGLQVQPPNFHHPFTVPLRPVEQNNAAALAAAIERLNEISQAGIDLLSGTTTTKVVAVWPLTGQRTNNPAAQSGRFT
uniref:Uncharacterized protein n=1 Tax=Meloidogyne floridensis TaxID=298350 RepID=A0A915NIY3_9BILA